MSWASSAVDRTDDASVSERAWPVAVALLALALVAAMAATLAWPSSAGAVPRPINGFIGGPIGSSGGQFTRPSDVAVFTGGTPTRSDDRILVAEGFTGNSRVQVLDGDGNFLRMWGRDVVRPGFAGNTGTGFEVCSTASACKAAAAGTLGGEFDESAGVAVDQATGHVYIVDVGNRRVQDFTLDGDFVRAWGWDVVQAGGTGDDTTPPVNGFEVCAVAAQCQAGAAGSGSGQFADAPLGSVAIAPAAPNHLFVTDAGNRRVLEFELGGDFVQGWGYDVEPGGAPAFETCTTACQVGASGGTANGQFAGTISSNSWPRHVAVDADGVVYASDSTDGNRIIRFDSDTATLLEPLPSTLLATGRTFGLELDSVGNLLVARDRSSSLTLLAAVQEIADPGADLPPGGPPNPSSVDTNVIADEADNALGTALGLGYSPATDSVLASLMDLFTPPQGAFTGCAPPPGDTCVGLLTLAQATGGLSASLDPPGEVGSSTASLQGEVEPGGGVARYRFQVSSDGENWIDASQPRYVAGSGTVEVSAVAEGLQPATMYRVRLVASKQTDLETTTLATSSEGLFLTDAAAPDVETLGSTARTDSSVRLRGRIDPNGSATSYRFEYGPAGGSFDHHLPQPDGQAGSGNSLQLFTQDVTGLQPDTAYHYRVVATNFVGTAIGEPVVFRTKPEGLPEPPPGRGYELVSPADKVAGVGVGPWYHGPTAAGVAGVGAYEGSRFAAKGALGSVLMDGKFAYISDWALASRTPDGWVSTPGTSRRAHGTQVVTDLRLAAASADISLMTWGSNGHPLKLFEEMSDWDLEVALMRDWAGAWEVFGPTELGQGLGLSTATTIAGDGSAAVGSGGIAGLEGEGDVALVGVENVYLYEVAPGGLSDTFPGDGTRRLVNVCTPGTQIPDRVDMGGGQFEQGIQPCAAGSPIGDGGATIGDDREGVITDNGSRVFFMSPHPGGASTCTGTGATVACPAQLYVRQRNSDGSVVTRWISRSEIPGQDASLMGKALFEGASADGDKVFFRSPSPLTSDDPNGEGAVPPAGGVVNGVPSDDSWDLYMYDLPDGEDADPAGGDLVRVSAGPDGDSDCNVAGGSSLDHGTLRFSSADGVRLVFACRAPVEGVPTADDGTITDPSGAPSSTSAVNLYAYDVTRVPSERWRFIANVPVSSTFGGCAAIGANPGMVLRPPNDQDPKIAVANEVNCVRGTSDGEIVTLWTDGRLTADDPDDQSADVYAYDAVHDELTRVSAPQGGLGGTYQCALGTVSAPCYGDGGLGAPNSGVLPSLGVATDQATGDDSVFFESRSRLLASDTDDAYDVYAWKAGELRLLSTGIDRDAFYKGNDRTGTNVYLATRQRLTWEDHDAVLDIYSARVGGGFPEPPSTDEKCDAVADQCQGGGASPPVADVDSDHATDGNPVQQRTSLTIRRPSAKALRAAARTGRLRLRVTTSRSATIQLIVRAKSARRKGITRRVRRRIDAGSNAVGIRLPGPVRRHLRAVRTVRLRIIVTATGARPAAITFALRRH